MLLSQSSCNVQNHNILCNNKGINVRMNINNDNIHFFYKMLKISGYWKGIFGCIMIDPP